MGLIDREALLSFEKMDADLCASCGEHHTAEDVIMMIKTALTVDAVPVVRCRECKHHRDKNEKEQQYLVEDILICTSPDATEDCWNAVWPDHFCSYGEKRRDKDGTT